jgi:sialate O-acetylesterase
MHNKTMNRRQFMRAGTGTAALTLSSEISAVDTDAGIASGAGRAHAQIDDVPVLIEDYQVIQRDSADKGACLIGISADEKDSNSHVRVVDEAGRIWMDEESRVQGGGPQGAHVAIENIPVGGPYTIELSRTIGRKQKAIIVFRKILVGDIWILAGQSNMFGIALAEEPLPALPYLNMLNNLMFDPNSHWCAGIPPIARVPDNLAPHEYKAQYPGITDAEIRQRIAVKAPCGGIGPEYFFARELYQAGSAVPVGVIPVALGAALAVWDPAKRDQNRCGFLYQQVMRAGGRVKGMLWYQGEQDAIFGDEQRTVTQPSLIYPTSTYAEQFRKFVEALRADFRNQDLVVITAQICRHHHGERSRYRFWEEIRETQRLISDQIPRVHTIPTIDLDLLDGLHLDYWSQKRLGRRMAYIALPYTGKGVAPRSEIKLKSVQFGNGLRPTIIVDFDGVTGRLRAPGRPTGFQLRSKTTGDDIDGIFKVDFDPERPARAVLHAYKLQKQDLQLVYAPGAVPYVNIVDENDMAIPAFGPVDVT